MRLEFDPLPAEPGRGESGLTLALVSGSGSPRFAAGPQLVKLLADPEPAVRLAAVEVLGGLGPAARPAAEKLKELAGNAESGDPQVGPAARKALERIGAEK